MKIYELSKIPGIGNEPPKEPDYEAIFQSGYTAGYEDGYASTPCYKNMYLTIEALEDGIFKLVNFMDYYGGWSAHTRLNGGEWEEVVGAITDYSLSQGDIMEIKGVYTGTTLYANLTLLLKGKVYGNILSLRDGDDFVGDDKEAIQGNGLFSNGVGLVDASNLVLPGEKPYYLNMFNGCTSLTGAPELTATTLVEYSYELMFAGCTSLTEAPELPATNLANRCYRQMFQNCTSLTGGTTRLPATVLFEKCYDNMFYNCTSLTEAPELSATNLAEDCCKGMFGSCTSLTTAPELPATNLARACYYRMFAGCTSLTEAPELLSQTLADACYTSMFSGCTNLNRVVCLATEGQENGFDRWLLAVSPTGTFYKHPDAIWPAGANGIPDGWTVVDVE